MSDAKLACRDVWKLYGPSAKQLLERNPEPDLADVLEAGLVPAVRAANLQVHSGEIFVIMGLSGSGKSTLVRCMSRLIEPTQGELIFEGQDLLGASKAQMIDIRRHKMGMVFQHFALLPHLSVLENVAFPLDIQGQNKQQREARAREIIELVGLAGREDYLPHELSGGQQQRVGIARSLAVEPEIWFLDEPFSALDPLIRREMQDEFLRLQAKLKKSIVFITHDFDEAIRLADRIAIMKEGAIVQIASPEELVLNPATDYVAEFTRYVPRDKVISVGSIMQANGSAQYGADSGASVSVRSMDKIADISATVFDAEHPLNVVDDNGVKVGSIDRAAIVDFLVSSSRHQQ